MCTSPNIRFRRKKYDPRVTLGAYANWTIKSLKELEKCFPSFSSFKYYFDEYMDYMYIPCRKCEECKAKYAQDWSIRCYHEFQVREVGAFITLTISDEEAGNFANDKKAQNSYCRKCKNGDRYYRYPINFSLNKKFILDWLKKFRDYLYRQYNVSIRYFGCGEYGEQDERPHYHILIFGYNFPDKMRYSISSKGVPIFVSQELSEQWKYGICTIQEINHRACMYTAKYCTKKMHFTEDIDIIETYYGREPEFLFMSKGNCQSNRCPYIDDIIKNCKGIKSLRELYNPYCDFCNKTRGGLGYDWLKRYWQDMIKIGYILIDGIKYQIPDYYMKIIKLTDEKIYDKLKLEKLNKVDELNERHPEYKSYSHLQVRKSINKRALQLTHRC